MAKADNFRPIEDYFILGDLRSAALVSSSGSIEWLCLPYFDSPSLFASMLDADGGNFAIDTTGYQTACAYLKDTAIIEHTLTNQAGHISIKDFMVPHQVDDPSSSQLLIRKIQAYGGKAAVSFTFDPKPKYARGESNIKQKDNNLQLELNDSLLILHLPADTSTSVKGTQFWITIEMQPGEEKNLILEHRPSENQAADIARDWETYTQKFWHEWVSKGEYIDFCRDYLIRSAITLKLMQFAPTGAMVAAPTTSLPEHIGGVRNWDYRYVWIRDATFTLYAFYSLGYKDEAERFFNFIYSILEKCSNEEFDVSLMYTIFGAPVPEEEVIDNFSGYKESRPVRVGNKAAQQFQLDVYGAMIDAYYFASKRGISHNNEEQPRRLIMNLINKIDEQWQKPDSGIWEVRAKEQDFIYSKVMCWVGADRAQKLKQTLGFTDEELQTCSRLADTIKEWIWEHGYNQEKKNLLQHPATDAVDSTNFLLVLLQFLDKHELKTKEIINHTRQELCYKEVFVYHYLGEDGLPGKEGAFLLCSFWLISALAILEETNEALRLFKKLGANIPSHGLIAEEIEPDTKGYLGNYPQAFSHLGYIMSAYYLNKYLERQKHRK